MGGRGPQSRITPEDIQALGVEFGYPAKTHKADTGTVYVNVGPANDKLTVRVPIDPKSHPGRADNGRGQTAAVLDTTDAPKGVSQTIATNEAGERYSDIDTVKRAFKYHFSRGTPDDPNWLTPPGSSPRYPAPAARDIQLVRDEPDPRQLKLLAAGAPPVPAQSPQEDIGPWKTTTTPTDDPGPWKTTVTPSASPPLDGWLADVQRETSGRFARPLVSSDDRMVSDTKQLTERVKDAADRESTVEPLKLSDAQWAYMAETLRRIKQLAPGYAPGDRESDVVDDGRGQRPPSNAAMLWENFKRAMTP